MANATSTELQELYVAYFGRAADPTGLDYWTEKGITQTKFAADMYAQAEFKDAYGSLTVESQVNQIYKNLFDREADVTGLTYWTQQINLGTLKVAEIATHLIWAAKNNSGSTDDKTALTNRTNAAVAYTAEVKLTTSGILNYAAQSTSPTFTAGVNITEAKSYLEGIDKSTAHTAAGVTTSVNKIISNGDPTVLAKTLSLTTSVDNFTGTAAADTFNADNALAGGTDSKEVTSTADSIDGGGGTDVLNIYSDGTVAAFPQLTSVETLNIYDEDVSLTLSAVDQASVTTVNMHRGDGIADYNLPINVTTFGLNNITLTGDGGGTADSTLDADAKATSLTLNLDRVSAGAAADSDLTVTGAKITTFTVATSGTASTIKDLNIPATTTTLNLDLGVGLTLTTLSATADGGTVNITGAGDLSLGTSSIADEVDVFKSTGSGKITAKAPADNPKLVATLGSGADTITTLDDGFATTDAFSIDAGDGEDTLVLTADVDISSADEGGRYKNFDVLQRAINANYDVSNLNSTIDAASIGDGGLTKMGVAMAKDITVTADNAGSTFTLAAATGTADVISFTSTNATATASADLTTVTLDGFETMNFAANTGDKLTTTTNDRTTIGFSSAADLKTLTLTGAYSVDADIATNSPTKITTLDASGVTGGAVLETGGQVGALTVTGSAVADTITVGAVGTGGSITVNSGGGKDTITSTQAIVAAQTFDGGAGVDTLVMTDVSAGDASLTINDATFKNVSNIETISLTGTIVGDLLWTAGGYANTLAQQLTDTTLKFSAKAITSNTKSTDIVTIDASNLSGTSAVNLDIKDTAVGATKTGAITLTGSDGADTITFEQAKAASASLTVITGGEGNDKITVTSTATHDGKIVVNSGAGDDTIDVSGATADATIDLNLLTPGAGNDTIKLDSEGAATDFEIVLGSTAALTGVNTITNFLIGTGGDVINPDAFLNAAAMNAVITADPGSSSAATSDVNLLVDITGGQDITTAAGLTAALGVTGEYGNVDMGNSGKAVFVTAATNSAAETQHLFYATSDAGGVITATKIGTVADEDIDSFIAANFNI
jgi:hypothetical protein